MSYVNYTSVGKKNHNSKEERNPGRPLRGGEFSVRRELTKGVPISSLRTLSSFTVIHLFHHYSLGRVPEAEGTEEY